METGSGLFCGMELQCDYEVVNVKAISTSHETMGVAIIMVKSWIYKFNLITYTSALLWLNQTRTAFYLQSWYMCVCVLCVCVFASKAITNWWCDMNPVIGWTIIIYSFYMAAIVGINSRHGLKI